MRILNYSRSAILRGMVARAAVVVLGMTIGASCARDAAPVTRAPVAAQAPLMSDPAEYRVDRISWSAGEAIFARTGIGDPYRTGIPYPVYLALMRAYPDLFGADLKELARRFGFVARAADASSDDQDVHEALPIGIHLTVDPYTGVPFVMHNCALCH